MGRLLTTDLDLANHQGETFVKNIKSGVLSSLAPEAPEIKVGTTDHFTFTGTPKAQLVGEGVAKTSADDKPTKATTNTYKVQMTYRYSDEVKYADEDYQAGLVEGMANNIATALQRALDLVAIHGINPATGEVAAVAHYFAKANNGVARVTATADEDADVEAMAAALQGNGYTATGIGFDTDFAGKLARRRDNNGVKLHPEMGLGFNVTNYEGLAAASSDTVSGRQELPAVETGDVRVRALMGDFRAFKWGIARYVPLELIEYGNPDGLGDLKQTNEVAIRAESIFGFAIFDPKAFALVQTAPAA